MMRIVLHIDRLVLHGIERSDAAAVTARIRAEVQRMLSASDTAQSIAGTGSRSRVAGEVRVAAGGGARALATAVAGRIVQGIKS